MRPHTESDKLTLIDAIAGVAAGTPRKTDSGFVRALYRNVPPEDLLPRSQDDLLHAAASLWELLQERRPGRPKLRVLDPQQHGHAWCAGRTVVQIVNDDMPFLVDSVTLALNARNLVVNLVIHPVLTVERAASGKLLRLVPQGGDGARESVMQVEIAGVVDEATRWAIADDLEAVLADVRATVVDYELMKAKAERIAQDIARSPVGAAQAAEVSAFLSWLADRNFTFLGYREYRIENEVLSILPGSGLGLLRDEEYLVFDGLRNLAAMSPGLKPFMESQEVLTVSKSTRQSTVHRRAQMDTISIKIFNDAGSVVGQKLFLGLFTSQSYMRPLQSVPILRRKVRHVIDRSGFTPEGHDAKELQHILDSFPRDELFQFDENELLATAVGILNLQERQRIALFLRSDQFGRFVSCLVYVPRDRYSTAVRRRMGAILTEAFAGTLVSEATHLDESVLARIHFIIGTTPGSVPEVDHAALEQRLVEAGRSWADRLGEALSHAHDPQIADRLLRRYGEAFPSNYAERTGAAAAVRDIGRMEAVLAGQPVGLSMEVGTAGALRLRTFHSGEPLTLSDVLPMLENFGFRVITEIPFETRPQGAPRPLWVQDFELRATGEIAADAAAVAHFEGGFARIWSGEIENDGFNRLVVLTGLSARQVVVLRTYCKILRQAGSAFSQAYMEDTLAAHPALARQLFQLFEVQFDPAWTGADRDAAAQGTAAGIEAALEAVSNLDEDRILRSYLLLIRNSLRTNYYQLGADGDPKPYLSIKLASREIELLPLPRPLVEVFVYSPRMEGCHLRGGRVARGGLRWSDRKEDFRTEILGLMKAQMVKNAVIVPVGSKGGFVVKRPPTEGGRDALMKEVVACYRMLIFGLLDITDNIQGNAIVPPPEVVRRDGDDPYLVVAADKGTATFSDIANGVALDYGFWLGDAFASGGSVGYDHKAMGITSRGAWEAVKRHFRELGRDIQSTAFTCVGVGDMSGDVFGNGMLLSKHTKLIAAFNHLHIFIDPDPDPATTWNERKRLFDLPRSGWNDYDTKLLSKGGAIYERSAKSITLSPEAQACLGLERATHTPAGLIRELLRASVDLLFFGGIGTYVKAATESQAEAGDRANDAVRLNGAELRAKVVGEGANLAVTQRGRIEYALRGGRINTDAIDNSAGVDTSDHEVNIKIGVGNLIASGRLAAEKRPEFLASMTDAIAGLVLEHNYLQTLALSLVEAESAQLLDQHVRMMRSLERQGRLDRAVEFLPDDEALGQRSSLRLGLTRPELAVILAYAKMTLYDDLLGSNFPDEPVLETELLGYFPPVMSTLSPEDLKAHRLRREIIATIVANAIINRMGPSFISDMQARTGRGAADIARAWRIVREALALPPLWREIEALDNRIPASTQTALFLAVQHVAEQAIRWFLQSGLRLDIQARTAEFAPGFAALGAHLDELLPAAEREAHERRRGTFVQEGASPDLAARVVALESLGTALDVVGMDGRGGTDIVGVGRLYFDAGARLGLLALRRLAAEVPATTPWQRMATGALADDFTTLQRDIVQRVLAEGDGPAEERLDRWVDHRAEPIGKLQEMLGEMRRAPQPDLAMLIVAGRQLRTLAAA